MLFCMVFLLFAALIAYEFSSTLKRAGKKTKIVYLSLMLISFFVLTLYSFDIPVPSPSDAISKAVKAIFPTARGAS